MGHGCKRYAPDKKTKLKITKAITQKIIKLELSFLYMTRRPIILSKCVKFEVNWGMGVGDIVRTKVGRTDGRTEGRNDGRTDGMTDESKPIVPNVLRTVGD